ncbi:MAG: glycosyltransferase family 39 protein, partial [Armatimonadota bacterium]|nr:glycosyltransferase family 39 protein [Armatimonadota bacterium]
YLLFLLDGGLYALLYLAGAVASPEDFAAWYFVHPGTVTLVGRAVAAACGLACVAVTYRLGCEHWGWPVGVGAAAVLAVSPAFVQASRMAKPDVLMTLFVVLAAWAVLRYLETDRARWLVLAAAAVGLGASTKYLAGLGVMWLLIAPWMRGGWAAAVRAGGAALCLAGVAFVVGTPFAVLDWDTFSADVARVAGLMRTTWYGAEDQIGYRYYPLESLPRGLGWLAALAALAGLTRWVVAGGPRERLLGWFVLLYYGWMGSAMHVGDLYILPLYPLLALAGTHLMVEAMGRARAWRPIPVPPLAAGLAVLLLAQPSWLTVRGVVLSKAHDTREVAGEWIVEHLPPGTKILSEPYGPFVPLTPGRLDEMIALQERRNPGHGMRLRFDRAQAELGRGYWLHEMELFNDPIAGQPVVEDYDLDRFLREGYRVVVLSSEVFGRYRHFPERYPVQNEFYRRVTEEGTLIARFDAGTPWCCPRTLNARLSEAAAGFFGRPGPTLLVYRFPEP